MNLQTNIIQDYVYMHVRDTLKQHPNARKISILVHVANA